MRYTVRPISDRTAFAGKTKDSPFTATWSATLQLLDRELTELEATEVVFEVDVTEGQIRLDGMLRGDAKAATPGVRIAFESKHGTLTYATDAYQRPYYGDGNRMASWQHNVRAIALGLESLRRVDRYGITKSGEQYAGWKQITAGATALPSMTAGYAEALLRSHGEGDNTLAIFRNARFKTHPDRNDGKRELWDEIERAAKVLGLI